MKILIACEYSGITRRAFQALGHEVISADFEDAEDYSPDHYKGDCFDLINNQAFDLMIAHPPCTHLAVSGARWFKDKAEEQKKALEFVKRLMNAPIERIAIENPISVISSRIRKPDQIIQPYEYGHGETKATCLWLKNLPLLKPTNIVEEREARVHMMTPGPNRWKERSRSYPGIALAMAEQWSNENNMAIDHELFKLKIQMLKYPDQLDLFEAFK